METHEGRAFAPGTASKHNAAAKAIPESVRFMFRFSTSELHCPPRGFRGFPRLGIGPSLHVDDVRSLRRTRWYGRTVLRATLRKNQPALGMGKWRRIKKLRGLFRIGTAHVWAIASGDKKLAGAKYPTLVLKPNLMERHPAFCILGVSNITAGVHSRDEATGSLTDRNCARCP
jgi:hypothetical protein